jgi:hypothetical protein
MVRGQGRPGQGTHSMACMHTFAPSTRTDSTSPKLLARSDTASSVSSAASARRILTCSTRVGARRVGACAEAAAAELAPTASFVPTPRLSVGQGPPSIGDVGCAAMTLSLFSNRAVRHGTCGSLLGARVTRAHDSCARQCSAVR